MLLGSEISSDGVRAHPDLVKVTGVSVADGWMLHLQNVNTVDVMFPSWPLFLYTNPVLGKYLLEPVLAYVATGQYNPPYAIHDIGETFLAPRQRRLNESLVDGLTLICYCRRQLPQSHWTPSRERRGYGARRFVRIIPEPGNISDAYENVILLFRAHRICEYGHYGVQLLSKDRRQVALDSIRAFFKPDCLHPPSI